jgi:Reverse transcriptase (RNA-dependent DNA polymerase)
MHPTQTDAHFSSAPADLVPAQAEPLLHFAPANTHLAQADALLSSAQADSSAPVPTGPRFTPAWPNTEQLFLLFTPQPHIPDSHNSSRVERIRYHLREYPNQEFPHTLVGITKYGARVGFTGSAKRTLRPNHASVLNHIDVIDKHIDKEISAGRVREITGNLPSSFFCSPLGLTPKKRDGEQTGWRMIFDLSCPHGQSVNDGIPREFGTLQYESFQHALRLVAQTGPNCLLLKKDLKTAFRQVGVSPLDWHLFIFSWRGKYYIDMFLAFGLRTSPRIYNMFAEGIHWTLDHSFNWTLSHYVDDFLGIFPAGTNLAAESKKFDRICADFGFPSEPSKDEMGTRVNHFGFEVDTVSVTATLSENKRNRAIKLLSSLINRKAVAATTLEHLLGFLSHCCEVVPVGRPFLRHLFNSLAAANSSNRDRNPYRYTRLSRHARRDILWWLLFLQHWSCISIIQIKRPLHEIWTDASGTKGIGGIYLTHLFSAHVPRRHRKKHINWKEMYAVLYAFLMWHPHWENGELLVHCDNDAVVDAINKRSIRGPTITPLQTLLLIAALFNITISAVWIPTASNSIADALSRHDFKRLANLGFQDYDHHNIRNSEPQPPVTILRQKLRSLSDRVSPSQPEKDTTSLSPNTYYSQRPTATTTSPQLSHQSPPGSLTSSNLSKPKLLKVTSAQSKTTISKTNFRKSNSPLSTKSSKAPNESTIKTPTGHVSHSRRTYFSALRLSSAPTSSPMTTSTSMQHFASDSPHSYEPASSPGINGILFNLLKFIYPANTSHLTTDTAPSHSSSHPQKRIRSAKGRKSTSPPRDPRSAQLQPSITCSNASPPTVPHHCSTAATVPSQGPISLRTSKPTSSELVSTRQITPATRSAKVQQSQQVEKGYHGPKSSYLDDGKAMQSTSTSTKSPRQTIKPKF